VSSLCIYQVANSRLTLQYRAASSRPIAILHDQIFWIHSGLLSQGSTKFKILLDEMQDQNSPGFSITLHKTVSKSFGIPYPPLMLQYGYHYFPCFVDFLYNGILWCPNDHHLIVCQYLAALELGAQQWAHALAKSFHQLVAKPIEPVAISKLVSVVYEYISRPEDPVRDLVMLLVIKNRGAYVISKHFLDTCHKYPTFAMDVMCKESMMNQPNPLATPVHQGRIPTVVKTEH
jgi:hypothetical protein